MTLEEHLEIAETIKTIRTAMQSLEVKCEGNKAIIAELRKANRMEALRGKLDEDFHRNITDEQFQKYGHIYYTL